MANRFRYRCVKVPEEAIGFDMAATQSSGSRCENEALNRLVLRSTAPPVRLLTEERRDLDAELVETSPLSLGKRAVFEELKRIERLAKRPLFAG